MNALKITCPKCDFGKVQRWNYARFFEVCNLHSMSIVYFYNKKYIFLYINRNKTICMKSR